MDGTKTQTLQREDRIKVVLLDDDEVFCRMISKIVKKEVDIDLHTLSNLRELARYKQWAVTDLLVLDYDLYDGTGLEAADLMSKIATNVPIVMISSTNRADSLKNDDRILGFMSKWDATDQFVADVRHYGGLTKQQDATAS